MKLSLFCAALALILFPSCSQVKERLMPEEKSTLEENLPFLALAAATLPVNPGSCSFTFGSSSVMIQDYTLSAGQSSTFANGFTYAFRNWAAVRLSAVAATTTVAFNYSPYYPSSTYGSIYLVYSESGCPLSNSSQIDWNRTADLTSARTPTNYTISGNTISFNAAAAGKNFIVVSAGTPPASASVTRIN